MFNISVSTKKGTRVSSVKWNQGACLLGRSKTNNIVLPGWRISNVHASIEERAGGVHIEATRDSKAVLVNETKHESFGPIGDKDLIQIGDYMVQITAEGNQGKATVSNPEVPTPISPFSSEPIKQVEIDLREEKPGFKEEDQAQIEYRKLSLEWRLKIQSELHRIMDLRRVNLADMNDDQLRDFTGRAIKEIIENFHTLPSELDPAQLLKEALSEAIGLGPLEDLINNDSVSEIMVNAFNEIFYEEDGQLKKSGVTFSNDASVVSAIERIVAPIGRRIDESSPMVDARLKDGSRVNAIIPPLALKGPSITIRKFMKNRLVSDDLVRFGSISQQMVQFLETAITRKRNVVISGGTGSGKTTLLNMLSNFIPDDERIITVEDAAELKLYQPNLVSLEARAPNQEGKGSVPIRELVKNCLRMRPDRIVVGECRGGEALDMLQAMNTGHDGSLTTVHSNSPRDCISRLEVLVLMSGMELPVRAIREQIASAVHIIVQQTRFSCGSRRVTSITEVTGVEGETVQLSEIFKFQQTGYDERGKVNGYFTATGMVPEFYEDLRRRGIEIDLELFSLDGDTAA